MSAESYPNVVSADQTPEASSLQSRRGIAILLLLSLVQFMDVRRRGARALGIGHPSSGRSMPAGTRPAVSPRLLLYAATRPRPR